MRDRIIVGIDPGTNTGLAVYDQATKLLTMASSRELHKALFTVFDLFHLHNEKLFVRVENAYTYVPYGGKKNMAQQQGAGSVKRDCKIWIEFLNHHKIPYELVSLRSSIKKIDAEKFKQYTKWPYQTNQHARDAAMLVWDYK